jgi:hypothetical protein
MYKTIDVYEFANTFERSDSYKNNFTRPALMALYDYLEEYEDSTGERYGFDMVALCCEYSEYESAFACVEEYNPEYAASVLFGSEDAEAMALEWLQDRTTVIPFDGGVVIAQF